MANLWQEFKNLLPKQSNLIGEVTDIDNVHKISTVLLVSGQSITVKGTSVIVGNNCLIQDGIIIQELPSLPIYDGEYVIY